MKFYGHGIVWNPEAQKVLCRFIDGELETDDESICSKLIERGYDPVIEVLEIEELPFTPDEEKPIKQPAEKPLAKKPVRKTSKGGKKK